MDKDRDVGEQLFKDLAKKLSKTGKSMPEEVETINQMEQRVTNPLVSPPDQNTKPSADREALRKGLEKAALALGGDPTRIKKATTKKEG